MVLTDRFGIFSSTIEESRGWIFLQETTKHSVNSSTNIGTIRFGRIVRFHAINESCKLLAKGGDVPLDSGVQVVVGVHEVGVVDKVNDGGAELVNGTFERRSGDFRKGSGVFSLGQERYGK